MPLIRIDAIEGRSEDEVQRLLDAAHLAMLAAFHVPERDRYQIYHAHPASHMVIQDTGLGITRTRSLVVFTVFTRARPQEAKERFYAELCQALQSACGIEPNDIMVCLVPNGDADWSFGQGVAHFLTGAL
jgi:phenylpyruvate tautomerase PptA (4-oxalocrotonate tautomerase family)